MKTIQMILISLSAALLLASCFEKKPSAADIQNGGSELLYKYQWSLSELGGEPVQNMQSPFLKFTQGDVNRINGHTGCNTINGQFQMENVNLISFSELATTRMACIGDNIESEFLAIFPKVDSWSISADELSLSQGGNLLAKFKGLPPGETGIMGTSSGLNGTWELNYISGIRIAFEGLYPKDKPRLSFKLPTLEAFGHTSCNAFNSTFALDTTSLVFNDPVATKMACEGDGEMTFFNALKKVGNYKLEDSVTLALLTDDVVMMRFMRK